VASVTAILVFLSLLAGCVTFAVGIRVGHGTADLASHLGWGAVTLVLQLFAASVAAVHARASGRQIAALRRALEDLEARTSGHPPGGEEGGGLV
jgi:hypothetical protein